MTIDFKSNTSVSGQEKEMVQGKKEQVWEDAFITRHNTAGRSNIRLHFTYHFTSFQ